MSKIVFKKIPKSDEKQLRNLISTVLNGIERSEFFIPYADWELDCMFDENYALLEGAYTDGKLVGTAQLYVQQKMLKEFKDVLGISEYKVCEFGGNLVLPEFRNQGIVSKMMKKLLEDAKQLGFDYVISMAHPDNTASLKSLEKVGLKHIKTTTVANGYLRDIYMLDIRAMEAV